MAPSQHQPQRRQTLNLDDVAMIGEQEDLALGVAVEASGQLEGAVTLSRGKVRVSITGKASVQVIKSKAKQKTTVSHVNTAGQKKSAQAQQLGTVPTKVLDAAVKVIAAQVATAVLNPELFDELAAAQTQTQQENSTAAEGATKPDTAKPNRRVSVVPSQQSQQQSATARRASHASMALRAPTGHASDTGIELTPTAHSQSLAGTDNAGGSKKRLIHTNKQLTRSQRVAAIVAAACQAAATAAAEAGAEDSGQDDDEEEEGPDKSGDAYRSVVERIVGAAMNTGEKTADHAAEAVAQEQEEQAAVRTAASPAAAAKGKAKPKRKRRRRGFCSWLNPHGTRDPLETAALALLQENPMAAKGSGSQRKGKALILGGRDNKDNAFGSGKLLSSSLSSSLRDVLASTDNPMGRGHIHPARPARPVVRAGLAPMPVDQRQGVPVVLGAGRAVQQRPNGGAMGSALSTYARTLPPAFQTAKPLAAAKQQSVLADDLDEGMVLQHNPMASKPLSSINPSTDTAGADASQAMRLGGSARPRNAAAVKSLFHRGTDEVLPMGDETSFGQLNPLNAGRKPPSSTSHAAATPSAHAMALSPLATDRSLPPGSPSTEGEDAAAASSHSLSTLSLPDAPVSPLFLPSAPGPGPVRLPSRKVIESVDLRRGSMAVFGNPMLPSDDPADLAAAAEEPGHPLRATSRITDAARRMSVAPGASPLARQTRASIAPGANGRLAFGVKKSNRTVYKWG